MDERSLKALKDAIELWERIESRELNEGDFNCPLCETFCVHGPTGYSCTNCPIRKKTGRENCEGTPYWSYRNDAEDRDERAHDEVVFLRSLLPEGEE
jgi:hypothetical protein